MTREEHIYQLEQYLKGHSICMCPSSSLYWKEHYEEIIKALEQETTTKNDLEIDCISRQAALEQAEAFGNGSESYGYYVNVEDIQALPPVTPQPRRGHWEWYRCDMYVCSECKNVYTDLSGIKDGMNYCPNCGSRNEVEE